MPERILTQPLLAALDSFIADRHPGMTRADALKLITREWLVTHGYLGADEAILREVPKSSRGSNASE